MTVREQERSGILTDFSVLFQCFLSYRIPAKIQTALVTRGPLGNGLYYQCPRCRTTLEREFTAYCDRCGQRLDWRDYKKVKICHHL